MKENVLDMSKDRRTDLLRIRHVITKTCPCKIQIFFLALKIKNVMGIFLIFSVFLPKTLIVGTCWNRLVEAVLMSTHNLCFGSKIREIGLVYPCKPQFYYIKVGSKGVYITPTCFP